MDYISNSQTQVNEMLAAIGVQNIEELFQAIPKELFKEKITTDDGFSELEIAQLAETLAAKNNFSLFDNYLGAGAYQHYVPAFVNTICSKSEFLTAYTPYQAEASQGILQAMFEFQSVICALTAMDVSNSSLYDGASACAEACLMAMRIHKERCRILVAESLNPYYRRVVEQYLRGIAQSHHLSIETFSSLTDCSIDSDTIAILVQSPNFFGMVEDLERLCNKAHAYEALMIVCGNPLSYGLYKPPGEFGADIAVGDCQPFGHGLNYGGPYVGYIACRQAFVRQLPGRLVGETIDSKGKKGYVLTLQAREQHIRRDKATSNICTSQTLAALASLITVLWYGKEGVKELALTNYQRAAYLKHHLERVKGFHSASSVAFFNEFVIQVEGDMETLFKHFRKAYIEPGLDLGPLFPHLKQHLLIAVTEMKSKEQLDHYIEIAGTLYD